MYICYATNTSTAFHAYCGPPCTDKKAPSRQGLLQHQAALLTGLLMRSLTTKSALSSCTSGESLWRSAPAVFGRPCRAKPSAPFPGIRHLQFLDAAS